MYISFILIVMVIVTLFFLKTLNANGLNNYSVHSTFFEFRSNTKCLPLRISLDFLYSIDIIVDCI